MIVLDTHAWIWYVDSPDLLSRKARAAADEARQQGEIYVSAISCWEIYMLEKRGRLAFGVEAAVWVARCRGLSFLQVMPVDTEIARLAVQLPDPLPADPADRLILATARYLGAPLVSRDQKIRSCPHVKTIW